MRISPLSLHAVLFTVILALAVPVAAQEEIVSTLDGGSAATTGDPLIPLDELTLRVKPLRRIALEVEAEAWLVLLEEHVQRIVDLELAVKYRNEVEEVAEEAESTRTVAVAPDDLEASNAWGDHSKDELLESLPDLLTTRTAIAERVRLVLDSLEAKGGTVDEGRQYVDAVEEVTVDLTDAETLMAALKGWVFSKQGGLSWLRNLARAFAILVAAFFFSSIAKRAMRRALSRASAPSALAVNFISKSIGRLVIFAGVALALMAVGFDIGPVLAMVGAAGFVVAFALQESLGNFASGILMLFYRPFDVGDVIEAAGVSGTVASMSLVSTHIRTFDNKAVVIPNTSVWGGVITNSTHTDQRRVDLVFGIGYSDSIPHATRILEEIAHEHELVLSEPATVIRLHELADSSVNFILRPWTNTADYWTVYWDITRTVKERFDAAGISIPFPQRDVHLHNETSS